MCILTVVTSVVTYQLWPIHWGFCLQTIFLETFYCPTKTSLSEFTRQITVPDLLHTVMETEYGNLRRYLSLYSIAAQSSRWVSLVNGQSCLQYHVRVSELCMV
jgi:hypothetical protein